LQGVRTSEPHKKNKPSNTQKFGECTQGGGQKGGGWPAVLVWGVPSKVRRHGEGPEVPPSFFLKVAWENRGYSPLEMYENKNSILTGTKKGRGGRTKKAVPKRGKTKSYLIA